MKYDSAAACPLPADCRRVMLSATFFINARNRRMNLLLCSGLLFLAIGIMIAAFERMLETTTESLAYTLYRYIAVGQYDPAPVNYARLMFPAVLAGIVGRETMFFLRRMRLMTTGMDIMRQSAAMCIMRRKGKRIRSGE